MVNNHNVSSRIISLMNKGKGRKVWSDEKLLARVLSVKTDKAYWNAIHELRGRASPSLYEQCLRYIHSKDTSTRVAGVTILSQLYRKNNRKKYGLEYPYRKEALKLFLDMLAAPAEPALLAAVLFGIGDVNMHLKTREIDMLLPFVSSREPAIRRAAVAALTGIANMKAIRGLIALSTDSHVQTRNWATFAIGTQSDLDTAEIRKALYARCTDKHYDTRLEAIYGLAKRKDEGVKPYLEKEFADCTVYVLESIEELHATEYLPRLQAMLEEMVNTPDVYQYWLGCLKKCIGLLNNNQV